MTMCAWWVAGACLVGCVAAVVLLSLMQAYADRVVPPAVSDEAERRALWWDAFRH